MVNVAFWNKPWIHPDCYTEKILNALKEHNPKAEFRVKFPYMSVLVDVLGGAYTSPIYKKRKFWFDKRVGWVFYSLPYKGIAIKIEDRFLPREKLLEIIDKK